ncbi:MAG: sugar transferase [Bacteroidia bacterium]|nr:sugar transferase [Bacteroidia bacterium]
MIRFFDILLSCIGLIVLFPIFLMLSIWIKLDSKGPVFYKQNRVGRNNVDFLLYKFRSMITDADKKGLLITVGGKDPRITKSGYFIRKYKLDELPQLINVFMGDMSLVGPRPEVRKYVDMYNDEQRKVLSIRPGITDYASIEYMDENRILGESQDPEKSYVEVIMPEKIKLNMKYIENQSLGEYIKIIFMTIWKIFV